MTRRRRLQLPGMLVLLCVVLLQVSSAGFAAGTVLTGRTAKIIDGDSVIVQVDGRNHEIRLWGIDCPEYDQPYAPAARKLTRKLAGKGPVRVEVKSKDSYGRVVGVLYRGAVNVNEELVRQGAAWVYGQYCREPLCRDWRKLETAARSRHLGLWRDSGPIAPWKWRRRK